MDAVEPSTEERTPPTSPKIMTQRPLALETRNGEPSASTGAPEDSQPEFLTLSHDDPENPAAWSRWRKRIIILTVTLSALNSTFGSTLPSGAVKYISKYFNVTNQEQLILPVTTYLIGYCFGPLLFAPLSETYGRKVAMVLPFIGYLAMSLGCALVRNWALLQVFRLVAGICAASPLTVGAGVCADLYKDPMDRGRAMVFFNAAINFGPVLGPMVSAFVSTVSWRWTFWVTCIFGVVSLPLIMYIPETFVPIILARRAKKMRRADPSLNIYAPIEKENKSLREILTVNLGRPLWMFVSEAVVGLTCLYSALTFSIFYLYFEAYPLVFQGIYHMKPGIAGLAFIPIGLGACIACLIFYYFDIVRQKARKRNASWAFKEEYRRLPLACVAGPVFAISIFWMGWSARPNVHWMVPIISGLPFGIGFQLIMISLLNYLTDAYEIFAASAVAASIFSRSVLGAVLSVSGYRMYDNLGVQWASTLLGCLSLLMVVVPFLFVWYGPKIRQRSRFCQKLEKLRAEEHGAENSNEQSQILQAQGAVTRANEHEKQNP